MQTSTLPSLGVDPSTSRTSPSEQLANSVVVAVCTEWHYFGLFPLRQFPLRQFQFGQLPISSIPALSIPIWSLLTKWELTKWELTKWEVDEVGRFTILYTFNHCYRSVNFLVHQSNLYCQEMPKLYGAPG